MTTTDYERVTIEGDSLGPPVDAPVSPAATGERLRAYASAGRPPIVRVWLGQLQDLLTALARAGLAVLVDLGRHAVKAPKYGARLLVWSPRGAWRLSVKFGRWIADADGRATRQDSTWGTNPEAHRRLAELHDQHVHHRLIGLLVAVPLLAVAALLAWWLVPTWVQVIGGLVLITVFGLVGRPDGRRITDRVRSGPAFVRLTAEATRAALVSLGLAGLKSGEDVSFAAEIVKDGPGWLARVDLPAGTEALDVIERRGKLASGFRAPVDQVWVSPGPDHAGQVDIWMSRVPVSKLGQPQWSLAAPTARTSVFEPVEIGTDQRLRPVKVTLIERNFLVGGVPGSGKSFAARTLATVAALDPTCELKIVELKGVGDFADFAPLCSEYVCGIDDRALTDAGRIITWALGEAERRGERIRKARERGDAPEGKITPELAQRKGSGLHPVLIVVDEAHELLVDKEIASAAERLVKRGRALGLMTVWATQIPDKQSVPTSITRSVNIRWCLAVRDHIANDQILGSGMYRQGVSATAYRPGVDAGWGVLTGLAEPTPVRSHFPDPEATARIITRARALRGHQVVAGGEAAPERDPVADAIEVFEGDRMHWSRLAEALAARWPDRWSGEDRASVAALLRGLGVPDEPVSVAGLKQRGCRLAALQDLAGGTAPDLKKG